jgi:small subunit ribosomal protein S8
MVFNFQNRQILKEIQINSHKKHLFFYWNLTEKIILLLQILVQEGLLSRFEVDRVLKKIKIFLKYNNKRVVLSTFEFCSKPGQKRYVTIRTLKALIYKNPTHIFILNTTKGLMSQTTAIKVNMGGELVCQIH